MSSGADVHQETPHASSSLFGEFVHFLGESKKWWLLPLVVTCVLIGLLVVLSSTGAVPFIYSMD